VSSKYEVSRSISPTRVVRSVAVVVTLTTLSGILESRLLRSLRIGVAPVLSTVRTWRMGLAPLSLQLVTEAVFCFEALVDRRVCVDLVCFKVELKVGARALLPLLKDI
jgi:hypothetical protein